METTKMSLDVVMRKIAKLKKLYEGAKEINSEGEANKAAAIMQKLLIEYNLTMEDVGSIEEKNKNNVLDEKISGNDYKTMGGIWEQRVTYVICKWNFCKCYIYGNSYRNLLIVGRKNNIELVKWLTKILKERFYDLAKKRWKEYHKIKPYSAISQGVWMRSYLIGCAEGLDENFKKEKENSQKKDNQKSERVTALVLRSNTEIDEYVKVQHGGEKKSNKGVGRHYNSDARSTGYNDGRNTNINRPLTNNNNAKKFLK